MIKPTVLVGILVAAASLYFPSTSAAQIDQICGETGGGTPWLNERAVYGRVIIRGLDQGVRFPKVTVILNSRGRDVASHTVEKSGNYCFRDVDGGEGMLTVEVEGVEAARQILSSSDFGLLRQFRQDFEVMAPNAGNRSQPGSISVKQQYSRSDANAKLFGEAAAAANDGKTDQAIKLFNDLVTADPADYIAWSQLGALYYDKKQYSSSEKAYQSALKGKPDLAPAMMNIGRIRLVEGKIDPAIEILKSATAADPELARAFQLLGEAYLVARKGTLGVEALNEAIRLDPVGMAESHLLMATLYDRAGAKFMATREYKLFLEKVPNHKEAKKLRKYIEQNPDQEPDAGQ